MEGRYWKQTGRYAIKIRQGKKERISEFNYTKDTIVDAINEAYRQLYQMNKK
jgi:hypothetical protein